MVSSLAIGNVVLNFGQIARVVDFHRVGVVGHESEGDPILKSIRSNGKAFGGKWVADPKLCRLLTVEELDAFKRGEEFRKVVR